MSLTSLLLFLIIWPLGAQNSFSFEEQQRQRSLSELIVACQIDRQKMPICKMIIELNQLGIDTVETIKTLIPMGPVEYFILTSINFATTGRLRTDLPQFYNRNLRSTLEYRTSGEVHLFFNYTY